MHLGGEGKHPAKSMPSCREPGGAAVEGEDKEGEVLQSKRWKQELGKGKDSSQLLGCSQRSGVRSPPSASPASSGVTPCPVPRHPWLLEPPSAGRKERGCVTKGGSMCESGKLPFGKCMSFSFKMLHLFSIKRPHLTLSMFIHLIKNWSYLIDCIYHYCCLIASASTV